MKQAIAIPIAERLDEHSVRAMSAALAAALAAGAAAIVIEGAPECFCLGMDFQQPAAAVGKLELLADLLHALLQCPCPTMAVVDGPALGGGLGMASACDFVLASDRASFGLPEGLYGLTPAIVRPALLTRLSPQKLRLLLFSCHARSAVEAKSLGLVDEAVPTDGLPGARRSAIRQLLRANGRTVTACRRWDEAELRRALDAGVRETASALGDPRILEALDGFTSGEILPWVR